MVIKRGAIMPIRAEEIDVGKNDTATFVTDLVNASTGGTVAAIRLPLEID
jgi:hypothetical protein